MLTSDKLLQRAKYWLYAWLVRFGRLRQFSMSVDEVSALLVPNLPIQLNLAIPGGNGVLNVLSVELSLPDNKMQMALLCEFKVEMRGVRIYQAHILATVQGKPHFLKQSATIRPMQVSLDTIQLLQDDYLVIKSSRDILARLLPDSISGWVNASLDVFSGGLYKDAAAYLDLYVSGGKQRVLDYHKGQIEKQLLDLVTSGELDYQLDEHLPDERLFARLGKEVQVQNGQLVFLFHR
ncbi:hypothetical protein [Bowmanella denitrificans]|uniref:hypothetical protein n=1 Tax=Bowmanella denitrificans TaxID=366582 RepID=UPI000C9C5733|nr:hypothetical protein [Bowmanella denitrificans]